jgi:hypothetical protein
MQNRLAAAACAALLFVPFPSAAQAPAPASPQAQRKIEEEKKLEEEIARELGGQPPATRPASPALGGRDRDALPGTPSAPRTGPSPFARLLVMPDLSAIGRAAIAYDDYDVEALSPRPGTFSPDGEPRAVLEELELGLQAVVDPYLRADVFVAFTPEEVEVEEAYVTTLSLPAALQVRAGKFYAPFGRQTQQHPHVWEFADAPLAISRLLAEETIAGPGVEVGWLAPLPWFAEVRVAGLSFAPGEEDPEALTAVGRVLQYVSLGEATTLGVGVSAALRDEGRSAFRDLAGVDVHLRWRPPTSRSWLSVQGEWYGRRFRGVEGAPGTDTGGYAQAFWKQGPFWGLGGRYDWAPTAGEAQEGTERRVGVLAGWFPSEFQRIRLQVSHATRPGEDDGIEALLHLEFGFGAHGAHPF